MKKVLFILALTVAAMALIMTGCGKKTASQKGTNISADTKQDADGRVHNFDVSIDERTPETQYQYADDDLTLVDTISGKKVGLGMSKSEIEGIVGAPEAEDRGLFIYDGLLVSYSDDKAVVLSVSSGLFEGAKCTRFKTTRGVGIGTTADDFKKAYGDNSFQGSEKTDESGETVKTASRAVRYFKKDGRKFSFVGADGKTVSIDKSEEDKYYIQDFMFSNEDNTVASFRVGTYYAIYHGK